MSFKKSEIVSNLDIMFGKLIREGSSSGGRWIHSIIDRNLAFFHIEKMINVLAAPLHDLLPKKNRGGRCYAQSARNLKVLGMIRDDETSRDTFNITYRSRKSNRLGYPPREE